jgi:hypothetical protein
MKFAHISIIGSICVWLLTQAACVHPSVRHPPPGPAATPAALAEAFAGAARDFGRAGYPNPYLAIEPEGIVVVLPSAADGLLHSRGAALEYAERQAPSRFRDALIAVLKAGSIKQVTRSADPQSGVELVTRVIFP